MSENEPGPAQSHEDDTAPLWSRDEAEPPVPDPGGPDGPAGSQPESTPEQPGVQGDWAGPGYVRQDPHPDPYSEDPYSGAGWSQPTQQLPYAGYPGWYPPPRPSGARLPGWVWPVVAATALVVGLVGGTVGGALVSSSVNGGDQGVSAFDAQQAAPPPLDPENGSVAAVAQALLPSTVQIMTEGGTGPEGTATGSGFVADRDGHVITNNHVVAGVSDGGTIQVIDNEGREHDATIVGRSPVYDIAVLDVEGAKDLQPAALGSSRSMNVGETAVAIGSPLGLSSTVTSGIISALDRPVTTGDQEESSYINAVQTDAAINPGNSGGPLVNLRGQVVGVNSAIATMGGFASKAGNIGVGFAIPMEQVKVTAAQIVRTGEAKYPVIGASVDIRGRRNGAEIVKVPSDTPAERAGLEEGDVVVALDGKPVGDGIGLIVGIRTHQPGETIRLTVRRDGEERTVQVRLDAKVG